MFDKVTLVYPYFHPHNDRSSFRFPPLGLGYLASYLERHNISVNLIDCTFLTKNEALSKIISTNPQIIGIYCMYSMKKEALWLAESTKPHCKMLIAGGPSPTTNPEEFLKTFDVVVLGEGEQTLLELVQNKNLSKINGIAYNHNRKTKYTQKRQPIKNLNTIPSPARNLFDNNAYQRYYKKFGYTTTSLITSRGCPFKCDFCSQPIFGNNTRFRSPEDIISEIKEIQKLGYDRIWFADDCFTIDSERLQKICDEIIRQKIKIGWECLSRVDTLDYGLAKKMKQAGCVRVFFGIESGNNNILKLMNKQITTKKAAESVHTAKKAGLQVGAFFILGYLGETNETILNTSRFAISLPLDYCSFTFPYPIPGTPLYEKIKNKITTKEPTSPRNPILTEHKLVYVSDFSETKLKFILVKATIQFYLKKYLGTRKYKILKPLEYLTDKIFEIMR